MFAASPSTFNPISCQNGLFYILISFAESGLPNQMRRGFRTVLLTVKLVEKFRTQKFFTYKDKINIYARMSVFLRILAKD
jgi:hypothetical protein